MKHGLYKARVHKIWSAMKGRCLTKSSGSYGKYGARGIKVCGRWIDSFEDFLEDMGHPPDGFSIDRIDGAGNYEPDNCRWVDIKTQNRNRSNTRWLTFKGKTKALAEWAEEIGMAIPTLRNRIRRGWTHERALTEPVHTEFSNKSRRE